MAAWGDNSYFSLHDICVTEERFLCKIEQTLPNLGFLALDCDDKDLKVGVKIEFPIWLIEYLDKKSRDKENPIISLTAPKIFKEHNREILDADARAVDLHKWNDHYYEMGLYFQKLIVTDEYRIYDFLTKVFKSRFKMILSWVHQNETLNTQTAFELTFLENIILSRGKKSKNELCNWLNKGLQKIEVSNVINNIRKRKCLDF